MQNKNYMRATVALVGKPNVGKSTLFNRLSIKTKAIVHDSPGVTRDRKYAAARLGPAEFTVIDTPGLEYAAKAELEVKMMGQSFAAVAAADLVCFVIDGSAMLTSEDLELAKILKKHTQNIILVANKCEKTRNLGTEYYKLGLGEPIYISAEHGIGMADLCEIFIEKLPDYEQADDPFKSDYIKIAVCGRPNAGKSSFINAIVGEDRLITGSLAGITRDSVEIEWNYKGDRFKLVDTAGVRKRGKVNENLEKLSVSDTLTSIRFANTVVLMIDAELGLEQQDLNLVNYVLEEGRSIVIAINKWDLIKDKSSYKKEMEYRLEYDLSYIRGVEVVYTSCLDKENIIKVIDACKKAYHLWNTKIATSKLNQWVADAMEHQPLPLVKGGRRVRIKYITQTKNRPPTFKLFTNYPDEIAESYKKYLIGSMRDCFNLPGVPIRMSFVKTDNPYATRK